MAATDAAEFTGGPWDGKFYSRSGRDVVMRLDGERFLMVRSGPLLLGSYWLDTKRTPSVWRWRRDTDDDEHSDGDPHP